MIRTREEAVARLKRAKYRLEAAAWLARSLGFTSREAVLCSLLKPPGWNVGTRVAITPADGSRNGIVMIHNDVLAAAVPLYLERCGSPTFPTEEAQDAYTAALERTLQTGLTLCRRATQHCALLVRRHRSRSSLLRLRIFSAVKAVSRMQPAVLQRRRIQPKRAAAELSRTVVHGCPAFQLRTMFQNTGIPGSTPDNSARYAVCWNCCPSGT